LTDRPKPDNDLIASELFLIFAPRMNFTVNSWILFDDFMHYATELLTISIINLIKNGYMVIEKEKKNSLSFFGKTILTQINYSIQLVRKRPKILLLGGWKKSFLPTLNTLVIIIWVQLFTKL